MRRHTAILVAAALAAPPHLSAPLPAEACDPYEKANRIVDEFVSDWGTVSWERAGALEPGAVDCPEPPCAPGDTCLTYEDDTPFVRVEALEQSPIYAPVQVGSYCFSIAKQDDDTYYHLHAASADTAAGIAAGFRYSTSGDGITWTPGTLAFPAVGSWYSGIICPDVHYDDDQGNMTLFFQAGANGIGRATSTDGGLTFQDSGGPVLTSSDPGYIVRTPSVARLGQHWYMVYNLVCNEPGTPPFLASTLNLATSPDGVDWTPSLANPIVVPGACGAFDAGATALGQLVADPDGETLHLFYTGAGWLQLGAQPSTRGCTKIAHALSTDRGRTWCKTGNPVLDHPPSGSGAWDTDQYAVSSYTWESGPLGESVLRMYYWGMGQVAGSGLGVAESRRAELPRCPDAGITGTAPAPAGAPRLSVSPHPNPTSGRTVVALSAPDGHRGPAALAVYDLRGRRVAEVWAGELAALPPEVSWNGRGPGGASLAAGRYLLRLEAAGATLGASWITVLR